MTGPSRAGTLDDVRDSHPCLLFGQEAKPTGRFNRPPESGVTLLDTPSEVFSDLLIAVLTGYIIHTVFRSELPASEESNFRWFLSGAVMYALLLRVSSELFT